MSRFLGSLFALQPLAPGTLWDEQANADSHAHKYDYHRRSIVSTFDPLRWLEWPRNSICGDDGAGNMRGPMMAQGWGEWQKGGRGNGSVKFIMGQCFDAGSLGVSGAIVQGFLTANDQIVGETTADSNGRYELGTPYPGAQHYLVAYRAGSPDICGTTVNTLTPTNRDGT
jgi:hypothetical protein